MVAWLVLMASPSAQPRPAVAAEPSLFDEPIALTDESGAPVSLSRWRGTPLVVTMAYTSCRMRCPLTIEKLRRVERAFARRGLPVQLVLVTLDPRRDTAERLASYKAARRLPASFHLLRADSNDETRALASLLGIHYTYDEGHIDHETRILILDRQGRAVRRFDNWRFDEGEAVIE